MAARYIHVSVQVGRNAQGPWRTPPGQGHTARRSKEQEYLKLRSVRKEIKRMIREENKAAQSKAQVSELERGRCKKHHGFTLQNDCTACGRSWESHRSAASPPSTPTDSGLVDQTDLKDCDCAPAWDCRCDEISCPYCGPRLSATASDSPPDGKPTWA